MLRQFRSYEEIGILDNLYNLYLNKQPTTDIYYYELNEEPIKVIAFIDNTIPFYYTNNNYINYLDNYVDNDEEDEIVDDVNDVNDIEQQSNDKNEYEEEDDEWIG